MYQYKAIAQATATATASTAKATGDGTIDMGAPFTWALFALLAVVGVAAAGFGLRRRND